MSKYEFIKYLNDGEECKELPDFRGYFVTTHGRVWSNKKQKFLKEVCKEGRRGGKSYYYRVGLRNTLNQERWRMIHTLVGRNFLPEYRDGLCILHRDETLSYPEINYLENLWVGTRSENIRDMWEKDRRSRNKEDNFGGYYSGSTK